MTDSMSTNDLVKLLNERVDFWNRHGSHDPEYLGYFSANDAMNIRLAAQRLTEMEGENGRLREALGEELWWAEIGHYLYDACSYSYGDGYAQPHELTISWEWQQSKPDTSAIGALRKDVDAWLDECRENDLDLSMFRARKALGSPDA